jgi:glycine/serine hydroxymethyltransferase
MKEKAILCSASHYKQGYAYNEDFSGIPENIRKELKVIAVCLAEKTRGIATLGFYTDNGDFFVEVSGNENDALYDEIGARLEANGVAKDYEELFKALSLWYRTFVIGIDLGKESE